jgi:hypothetical protein
MNRRLSVQTVVCAFLFTGACTVTTSNNGDGGSPEGGSPEASSSSGSSSGTASSSGSSSGTASSSGGSSGKASSSGGSSGMSSSSGGSSGTGSSSGSADGGAQDTGAGADAIADTGTPSEGGSTYNATEPNDDFAHANTINAGDTIKGAFSGSDDTDYFVITIPAGSEDGVFTVTVDKGTAYSASLDVYDSTQTRFDGSSATTTTSPFVSSYQLTAGSKYYLRLTSNGDGMYSMTTSFVPVPDMYERNDDFSQAKAAPIGTAFNVYIFAGHDTNMETDLDYFTLAVPANATKVGVSFTNNSTSQLPQSYSIDLYDPSKARVTGSSGTQQANISDMWSLPNTTGGTYYVRFTANSNSTVASSVTLTPQ